jgi:ATPase subunit of ABC transporter with duplicated ATPase domains
MPNNALAASVLRTCRHTSHRPVPARRFFLDNVAGWILELSGGKGIPFEGNYSQWLQAKAKRQDAESKAQSALQRSIDAELDWVASKAKGQQKKGKARMRRYEELCSQVGGGSSPPPCRQHRLLAAVQRHAMLGAHAAGMACMSAACHASTGAIGACMLA